MNRIKEVLEEKEIKQAWEKLQHGQWLCPKPTTAKT